MALSIPTLQQSVGLIDDSPPLSLTDDMFSNIVSTIIEELSCSARSQPFRHNQFLYRSGYIGSNLDADTVQDFLFSSLQAHRIMSHLANKSSNFNSFPHFRLSFYINRMFLVLNTPPIDSHRESFPEMINQLTGLVCPLMVDGSSKLQEPILSAPDCSAILSTPRLNLATKILSQLQKEHTTRIGLLLTRLHVTTLSFSRAQLAKENSTLFSFLSGKSQALQQKWMNPHPITLFQIISARKFLLVDTQLRARLLDKPSSSSVKEFIMGRVPDRGGRIASRSEMPQFEKREETVTTKRNKSGDYRKKASSTGRKRK